MSESPYSSLGRSGTRVLSEIILSVLHTTLGLLENLELGLKALKVRSQLLLNISHSVCVRCRKQ
jgi:hypothetical protein